MPSVARFSKKKNLSFPCLAHPGYIVCFGQQEVARQLRMHRERCRAKSKNVSCADTPPETQSLSSCVANSDGGSGHF